MKVHDLDRAELGHQRMPQYYSGGTIPNTEQERLQNINAALFKRGLPQVTSILEWEQRVKSQSNPQPPERPYTEQEHLDLQRWMNGGVVRFSSLQHHQNKTSESP